MTTDKDCAYVHLVDGSTYCVRGSVGEVQGRFNRSSEAPLRALVLERPDHDRTNFKAETVYIAARHVVAVTARPKPH